MISLLNTLASGALSVGLALVLFAAGMAINFAFATKPSDAAEALVIVFAPFSGVLGILAFAIMIWANKSKGSVVRRIKEDEAREEETPGRQE